MEANGHCDLEARILRLKADVAACTMSVLVAAVMLLSAGAAHAQDGARAKLLVAAPDMPGPYGRTVVIVVSSPQGHHAGVILNRATPLTVAAAFPGDPAASSVAEPIHFGGPQGTQSVYALVRGDPGEGAVRLFDEVFMTAAAATVDRVMARAPQEARYFAGFVAWLPGKLESEIAAGQWYVGEPDEQVVFRRDGATLWVDLAQRFGAQRTRNAMK